MKRTFLWCFLLAKPFYYFGENLFPCVEGPDGQNTHPHTHPTPQLPAVSILAFFSLDSAPGLEGPSGRGLGLLPILVALSSRGSPLWFSESCLVHVLVETLGRHILLRGYWRRNGPVPTALREAPWLPPLPPAHRGAEGPYPACHREDN